MKKILSILAIALMLTSTLTVVPVNAATEEEIEASIALGLPWLAAQQNPDGSWSFSQKTAKTGLAVLKFIDYVKEVPEIDSWTDPAYIYHDVVVNGLNYLFSVAGIQAIGLQAAGDPDTNGNGIGVYYAYDYWSLAIYQPSIALMAIAATDTPDRVVDVPGSPVDGWTYAQVVQDTVDLIAWAQNEVPSERGGWGYGWNVDWSDNSVSGYASLGLGYAQGFGATIPQFVKDELILWINAIQAPEGHSWYRTLPNAYYTYYGDYMLKTGNLLYEMALAGLDESDARVQAALDWIKANWASPPQTTEYQTVYCLMKGFEAYGIDEWEYGGTAVDWFDDLSTWIISKQNPDGSWEYGDQHDYEGILSAAWCMLTLEKAVVIPKITVSVDIKPGSWPNPFNKDAKGVFSVAICGTEDFDASTVDPVTIEIYFDEIVEGDPTATPLRWSIEDVATPYETPNEEVAEGWDEEGDGYMDLVLKFSREEVTGLMTCEEEDMSDWKLYLTGNLKEEEGGTPLEGFDWIRVQMSKGKK